MHVSADQETFEVRLATPVPLRGVVRLGDREPQAFEGWVELAAVVQAMVNDASAPAAD